MTAIFSTGAPLKKRKIEHQSQDAKSEGKKSIDKEAKAFRGGPPLSKFKKKAGTQSI